MSIRIALVCCALFATSDAFCAQGGGGGRAGGGGGGGGGGAGVGVGAGNNRGALAQLAPSSVVGTAFDVMIGESKGTKKKTRLTFSTKKLSSDWFASIGVDSMTFEEKKGKTADAPVTITALATDAKGGKVELDGQAVGDGIKGTVTITAKDGKKQELVFDGGKPGSDEAKKAIGPQ